LQIVAGQGSLLEVSDDAITAYHAQGNTFFEARRTHAVHPQHLQFLERRQRAWHARFERLAHDHWTQQEVFADLLEDGHGSTLCSECNQLFGAELLTLEEGVIDGVDRRRFLCPVGHELWIVPGLEVMGVCGGDGEGQWRPRRAIHRSDEWRRFTQWLF